MVLVLKIEIDNKTFSVPLADGIEISRPIYRAGNVKAYFVDPVQFRTYTKNNFLASTALGASVNCEYFTLNPHGQSTHIECFGHISKSAFHLHMSMPKSFYLVQLVDVVCNSKNKLILQEVETNIDGLICRYYKDEAPLNLFSGADIPSFSPAIFEKHNWEIFVTDMPSIDPENDDGKLLAHKAFWWNESQREKQYIVELAKIPSNLNEGLYLLEVQCLNIQSDASPARLIVYPVTK